MVLDGAMGALIYAYKPTEEDLPGRAGSRNHPVRPEELHRGPGPDPARS